MHNTQKKNNKASLLRKNLPSRHPSFFQVPPTCSVQITSYEVQYFSMVEPETKLISTLPSDDSALIGRENVVVNYTVTNLSPHLRYSLRVRIYGYQGARGGGYGEGDVRNERLSHLVISNYSNFISFQTLEDGMFLALVNEMGEGLEKRERGGGGG